MSVSKEVISMFHIKFNILCNLPKYKVNVKVAANTLANYLISQPPSLHNRTKFIQFWFSRYHTVNFHIMGELVECRGQKISILLLLEMMQLPTTSVYVIG